MVYDFLEITRGLRKTSAARILFFLLSDIIFIVLAIWLAFFLRFDGEIPAVYLGETVPAITLLALVFCLPLFYFLGLYSFSWTYVSAQELISLFRALTLSYLFLGAALFVLRDNSYFLGYPRSTLFVSYFLTFLFCGGVRFAKRLYLQLSKKEEKKGDRTLIVGAGDAGEQILRSILASQNSFYVPVGFIDDSPLKRGLTIHGFKVLGNTAEISKIAKKEFVEQIIVALPSASSQDIRRAVEEGRNAGLKKISIVPSVEEIINGQVSIKELRDVQPEDLLQRSPVSFDKKSIEDFIRNKRVLVTGASGSIGSELARQIAKFEPSLLLLLDKDETGIFHISRELKEGFPRQNFSALIANIRDEARIDRIFDKFKPELVFHAAAYKHVPLMEEHPDEAVINNIGGTEIVGNAALKHGVDKFIFISTDKAVRPSSVMGATKRIGELICQNLNQKNHTRFMSVRFGNVLNSRGSVIPLFKEQIRKGGPVTVTHPEMKRYFMMTSEAVLLVLQAGAMGQGGEVFVLDMGEPIKIVDLAKELIRLSGFEADREIPIVFTKPRPGEKLFEDILTAEEGTIATRNKKIFIAKLSNVNENDLKKVLSGLKISVACGDKQGMVNLFKELIPSYLSQNALV